MKSFFSSKYFVCLLFGFICMFPLMAQEKIEIERRAKPEEIPSKALTWVGDAFGEQKKVKWYFEESDRGKSFEAKFTRNGETYSVEFNVNGELEDVEINRDMDGLSGPVKDSIKAAITRKFNKYRIRKIQHQFLGKEEDIRKYFTSAYMVRMDLQSGEFVTGKDRDGITVNYEIEMYGRNDKEKHLWELLFDENGKLIEKRKINQRATDNLNY